MAAIASSTFKFMRTHFAILVALVFDLSAMCSRASSAAETPEAASRRHERVAQRRERTHVICHRGAVEFAHENTLEAYRASFELGADGNEIDIRRTKDGVLVCFHDDMLDRLLNAYGMVPEVSWEELKRIPFRSPGKFAAHCRIPTLAEVLELHRDRAGLLHLDIKEPRLEQEIAALLDKLDMWDHVAYCNAANGPLLIEDKRMKLCRYKGSLYAERAEVDPEAIRAMLEKPGEGLIVDDPRASIVALGRKIGKVSHEPVTPDVLGLAKLKQPAVDVAKLVASLQSGDARPAADSPEERARLGRQIRARAKAAEMLAEAGAATPEVFAALEERVRNRSLHPDWMFHGFDGAMALRALVQLKAPQAAELARFVLWRDDPAIESVIDPRFKNPRAWTDFRVKMVAFPALEKLPGAETERVCRDYLALSDEEARRIGPPQFEEAARTLLAASPRTQTARELFKHRLGAVRGRAVLHCLSHGNEPWAQAFLNDEAPYALAWLPLKE